MSSVTPTILHLSLIAGSDLRDADGGRLGRVDDLLVRLGDDEYPPVSGALARVAGREVFVPAERIGEIEQGRVTRERAHASTCSHSTGARVRCCSSTTSSTDS